MDGLTHQRGATWEDVFAVWQAHEGSDPVWQRFATEEKGWNSWKDWREFQFAPYQAAERTWNIYTIDAPNTLISSFRVGPYKGWQQPFTKKHIHTFADFVSVATDTARSNIGVQTRLQDFPEATQLIGLHILRDDSIVLIEGHHRATAVALAAYDGAPLSFTQAPTIALARVEENEFSMLDKVLATPSNNPNHA